MPRIVTTVDALSSRGQVVRQILKEISSKPTGPAWKPRSTGREYIIGAHSGSPTQSDYRSWRFPTIVTEINAMYFELWKITSRENAFLDRAYLSLYRKGVNFDPEDEILALHCDPNEPDIAEHAVYKQGPHLHLIKPEFPGPHAHIALNRCHLPEVLHSVESFTSAFHSAVVMIRDQVLRAMC